MTTQNPPARTKARTNPFHHPDTASMNFRPLLPALFASVTLPAAADTFQPVLDPAAVSIYVCRTDKPRLASVPPAESPTVRVGTHAAALRWGDCLHTLTAPGEIELVAEPGAQGSWSFGRFGVRFDAAAGSARVFRLDVAESHHEERADGVMRHWVANFRETQLEEAGLNLRAARATKQP